MKLYYGQGACSLAPHIIMAELNMVYELEAVSLKDKTCASGADFKAINPKGSVPALKMDNNEILTETAVISQYLCDQVEGQTLLPKFGTMDRYRTMEWMNFIATEVHKSFTPLFFASKFYSNTTTQNDVKEFSTNFLNTKFAYISEKLGDNKFLTGENFTIADAYMFTVLGWSKYVGLDYSNYSNISNYMSRVAERPAVLRALKEEGLLK